MDTVEGAGVPAIPQTLVVQPTNQIQLSSLSTSAIFNSVAIHAKDEVDDPLNYRLGMWGKLLILGVIQKQGENQNVDFEANPEKLKWDEIFRELIVLTPLPMQHLVSVEACRRWYTNRLRIYKETFPNYHRHESAADQLMHHYALQLNTLQESAAATSGPGRECSRYYWENGPQTQNGLHTKSLLLSVLFKLRDGEGLLDEMSQIVESTVKGCMYTLSAIENQIRKGEINDVQSIVDSCRCLVMTFLLSQKGSSQNREVPQKFIDVLNALRTFKIGITLPGNYS